MELDHLFAIDNGQIKEYDENDALLEQVRFWLNTPRGERWGDPSWGHELIKFKHSPETIGTEIAIEAMIYKKLPRDLPSIDVRGVKIAFVSQHEVTISVYAKYGVIEENYNFQKAA